MFIRKKELSWAFQMGLNGMKLKKLDWQKFKPGYYTIQDVIKIIQQYINNVGGKSV